MSSGTSEEDANGTSRAEPAPGDRIGPYRLLKLLGGRASGPVYEVEDLEDGGRAAMRVLPAERAAAFGAVRRLFIETRALTELKNPHLVAVTDLIEAQQPGEVSAIVMELLDGRSLARLMAVDKALSTDRIISILSQVLDALKAIHQVHLVHGDLKPENIFLTSRAGTDDYVKLMGFGQARSVTAERASEEGWGEEDTSINTPAYLSPEQAFGKEPDHRTDIYSFGVILYQLVCGRLPFGGRNLGELLVELEMDSPRPAPRHVQADPVRRTLDSIARRCLEKDPSRRWASADELKTILDRRLSAEGADHALPAEDPPRLKPRPRWLVRVTLAAALALAGATFLYRLTDRPPVPEAAPPGAAAPDPYTRPAP